MSEREGEKQGKEVEMDRQDRCREIEDCRGANGTLLYNDDWFLFFFCLPRQNKQTSVQVHFSSSVLLFSFSMQTERGTKTDGFGVETLSGYAQTRMIVAVAVLVCKPGVVSWLLVVRVVVVAALRCCCLGRWLLLPPPPPPPLLLLLVEFRRDGMAAGKKRSQPGWWSVCVLVSSRSDRRAWMERCAYLYKGR